MNGFLKLCSWVYGQEKYSNGFGFNYMPKDYKYIKQHAKIELVFSHSIYEVERVEQLKKNGLLVLRKNKNFAIKRFVVEICSCYEDKKLSSKIEYSISAGAQDNSLILYHVTNYSGRAMVYPLERITFLDLEYLKYIP